MVDVKLSASRSKKDYSLSTCYFTFSADAVSSSLPIVFYTPLTAGVNRCFQCSADFLIPLVLFQTCSSLSSPQSAPASLGCQGPAPPATCPRAAKALTRHVQPICGTGGSRAGAQSCKLMTPHPWKLRVLHCASSWESGMQKVAREETTAGGALGCIASLILA